MNQRTGISWPRDTCVSRVPVAATPNRPFLCKPQTFIYISEKCSPKERDCE